MYDTNSVHVIAIGNSNNNVCYFRATNYTSNNYHINIYRWKYHLIESPQVAKNIISTRIYKFVHLFGSWTMNIKGQCCSVHLMSKY